MTKSINLRRKLKSSFDRKYGVLAPVKHNCGQILIVELKENVDLIGFLIVGSSPTGISFRAFYTEIQQINHQ